MKPKDVKHSGVCIDRNGLRVEGSARSSICICDPGYWLDRGLPVPQDRKRSAPEMVHQTGRWCVDTQRCPKCQRLLATLRAAWKLK